MKEAIDNNPVQQSHSKIHPYDHDFELLRNVKENIPGVLQIAFRWYQLDDYLAELWQWLQAAIGNDIGAYVKGDRRIGLLKFYDSLLPLLEALNAINETNKIIEQTGDKQQKSLAESDLSMPPQIAIQEFCRSFSRDNCRMEIWDWLDAAMSNDDFYNAGLDRSFLLIEYQCIYSLIEAAYLLCIQYEGQILQTNETGNVKSKPDGDALIIIRHFFMNTPLVKTKSLMQEFYSAWVHSTAENAAPNEHSDKLLFCEYITHFFSELHELAGLTNKNASAH